MKAYVGVFSTFANCNKARNIQALLTFSIYLNRNLNNLLRRRFNLVDDEKLIGSDDSLIAF